ncbi:MAG: hypothetical protein Ct9H90mP7_2930 [Candidatus Neomarinimicrobiota bacterium]|nr:MAG: hypothetical protein Ct9H90mP7_2930 [Candidatus Neomarinimicrobiota bacterium]
MRQLTTDEKFWSDNKAASFQLKKISILEKEINLWKKLDSSKSDYGVLIEFFESGEVSLDEVKNELSNFVELVEDVELKTILGEETRHSKRNNDNTSRCWRNRKSGLGRNAL